MYRPGHYGVALLTYAPVGFLLLIVGQPTVALAAGAVVLALTPLPDYDKRVPLISHRGVTHTVLFVVAVGAVVGVGTYAVTAGRPDRPLLAALGFGAGALAIVAHLLGDVITPAGLRPFWPLSRRKVAFPLTRADSTVANYLLLAAGVLVTALAVAGAVRLGGFL